jgi:hypothetical protein
MAGGCPESSAQRAGAAGVDNYHGGLAEHMTDPPGRRNIAKGDYGPDSTGSWQEQ